MAERASIIISKFTIGDVDLLNDSPYVGFMVTLNEDINANFITGTVVLSDSFGGINKSKFTGSEKIMIEFAASPTPGAKKTFTGRVAGLPSRTNTRPGLVSISLDIVSEDYLKNIKKLSKVFKGKHKDVIVQVYKEIGTSKLTIGKDLDASQKTKVVVPYWHPFDLMNWLAARTLSGDKAANFYFYATLDGEHCFKSISSMMKDKQRPDIEYFDYGQLANYFSQDDEVGYKYPDDWRRVNSLDIYGNSLSFLRGNSKGSLGGILTQVNLSDKTYDKKKKELSIKDLDSLGTHFGKTLKLEDVPDEPYRRHHLVSPESFSDDSYTNDQADLAEKIVLQRNLAINVLKSTLAIEVHTAGLSSVKIGQTIKFNLLGPESHGGDQIKIDQRINGDFIVCGIKHSFSSNNEYYTTFWIAKDAIEEP